MSAPYARFFTPPLHGGSFSLPRARDVVKTSVFTRPRKRDSSSSDPLVPNLQSVSRMSIGLAATIPISERVGIQLGGAYSQKGGSLEVQEDGATIASDIEFDYIELTVLARVGLPLSGDRVSAHLLVGPALAFQSSCQVAISAGLGLSDQSVLWPAWITEPVGNRGRRNRCGG